MIKVAADSFILICEVNAAGDGVAVTGYEGAGSRLTVPSEGEYGSKSLPVTAIDKKAFLGLRGLRDIALPATVTDIGDWALSQCIHLTNVIIEKGGRPAFQRGVFEGSERIESIRLSEFNDDDMPYHVQRKNSQGAHG